MKWSLLENLETLEQITGVPAEILSGIRALDTVSVAARMSWAAHRETTRAEDGAYCLLGIFDVNMPLLYGEGRKAFAQLQSKIMSQTQDESLFACPREFAGCGDVKHFGVDTDSATTVFGNGRISLNCGLMTEGQQTLVAIKCFRHSILKPLAIEVTRIGVRTYLRSNPSSLFPVSMRPFGQDIIIEKFTQRPQLLASDDVHQRHPIQIGDLPRLWKLIEVIPSTLRNSTERRLSVVDALEAKKVVFHFESTMTTRDIFLMFWADQPDGSASYRYRFDVVSEPRMFFEYVPAATQWMRKRGTWVKKMNDKQKAAFLLDFLQSAETPREMADCDFVVGLTTVHVSPSRRIVDGHEVVLIQLRETNHDGTEISRFKG